MAAPLPDPRAIVPLTPFPWAMSLSRVERLAEGKGTKNTFPAKTRRSSATVKSERARGSSEDVRNDGPLSNGRGINSADKVTG